MPKVIEQPQAETSSRIPSTQEEIKKRVLYATDESLFWLRVNTAEWWLGEVENIKDKDVIRERYMKSNGFWEWWIKMFSWNDRLFLDWMDRAQIATIEWGKYVNHIKLRQQCNWRMTPLFPEVSSKPVNNPNKEENPPIENPYKEGIGKTPGHESDILKLVKFSTVEKLFWLRVEYGLNFCTSRLGIKDAKRMLREKKFWDWWIMEWDVVDERILKSHSTLIVWELYCNHVKLELKHMNGRLNRGFEDFVKPHLKAIK